MVPGTVHIQYGLSINIPRGVPVALFLTNRSNLRDSQVVKTKASENAYVHDVCTAVFTLPFRHYNIGSSHNALQNYKIFWNKSALQPKICKKEAKNLEVDEIMLIFAM